jgi:hypothetical protein
MNKHTGRNRRLAAGALVLLGAGHAALAAEASWTTAERDGRVEARRGDALMFAWQAVSLEKPAGGAKFAGSAFLHPLRTPSGFEWTAIQPADHLHHFGVWWPWKFIEVDGRKYNCWEIQEGQGAHVAKSVKPLAGGPDAVEWEFSNETVIRQPDAPPVTVIKETARVALSLRGADAVVLDVALRQQAAGAGVKIINYRYSGFSWRGPASWNKDNSRMLTSEGHDRDNANGKPARWVVVNGPTPNGSAAVLLMSAATDIAGTPERLRVWDSKTGNGTPFVNFNPVMEQALPLDDAHPAVSKRNYRVLAADREMDAAAAEAEWRKWLKK